jgi:uncharacterized protein DUF4878
MDLYGSRPMRRATTILATAAIAVAGCGGGPADDVESAIKSYIGAFKDGDGEKACSLMTRSTRKQFVTRTKALTKTTDCAAAIEAIRTQAGQPAMDALKKVKVSDVKVNGNTATARLSTGKNSSTATLKKEDGAWKVSGAPGAQ